MQRVRDSLDEMGFTNPEEILGLYPFQMSGGMLQRVMIALALSLEAPLLIADEPTTDLDVLSQDRILNLLRGLRDKHEMGILLVTHDLGVIASLADTVAVMEDGEIVETGSVAQIFSEPVHPFTKMLLKAHFGLYGVFADIPALREGMRQR
jgi:nickel transport system ATP-binding protein